MRSMLVLLAAAGVAALAWFLLGEGDPGAGELDVERTPFEEPSAPELRGFEGRPVPDRPERTPEGGTPNDPDRPTVSGPAVAGVVLALESDDPLPGVRLWTRPHHEDCPEVSDLVARATVVGSDGAPTPTEFDHPLPFLPVSAQSDAEGRFAMRLEAEGAVDVFALADGRVLHVECNVVPGEDLVLRLAEGLALTGRVLGPRGGALAGVRVRAVPAPETAAHPGHGTVGLGVQTDEEGTFRLTGLLAGDVMIVAEHRDYMPRVAGPYDPATAEKVVLALIPAFRATFQIRTDDGRAPEHPRLTWETGGAAPKTDVVLLACDPVDGIEGELTCQPVRIPCDAPSVSLRVTADSYATWSSGAVELPAEGGGGEFVVTLTGDSSSGTLELTLENDRGESLHAAEAGVRVSMARLDPGVPSASYVLELAEIVRISALPAGRYRISLTGPAFAPATVDVRIDPGRTTETPVRVADPAKLRVRFTASLPTIVRFRVLRDGRDAAAYPEGGSSQVDPETGEAILSAGEGGLLLTGLGSGTYVIEVVGGDVTARPTSVRLHAGDTEDVEIPVQPR